jgi:hypothetical protein
MDETIQDVASTPEATSTEEAASSTAVSETAGESQGGVNATAEAQTSTQQQAPVDVLDGLPSLEELQAQAAQKVPMAQGLYNVRAELERVRPLLKEY